MQLGKPLEDAEVAVPDIGTSEVLVRVAACGICHSDAHYRAGISSIDSLPVTPGHEVAGRVEAVGEQVTHVSPGDRVCIHYLVSCGVCDSALAARNNSAPSVNIGKHRDGGYAEFIAVPGRNVFDLPDEYSFEQGAIMMCSSATALHAQKRHASNPASRSRFSGSAAWDFQRSSWREPSIAARSMLSKSSRETRDRRSARRRPD